jgi:chromate reductase
VQKSLRVVTIVGSLRRDSYTRRIVNVLKEFAPATLTFELASIGHLPPYNEDDDTDAPPDEWRQFRHQVRGGDAVLFATPEYNRSIPGVLKNAVDVGSRPYGSSAWQGKPAAVISVSPGSIGGFGANHHLRQCLTFLDMPVMQQPEAYIAGVGALIDEHGRVTSAGTARFLERFIGAFEHWIRRLQPRGLES